MRYFCLVCDYDGTIARDGQVAPSTLESLTRVRASGRKLLLATGRELRDLLSVFPEVNSFDLIVAENGGLLYWPASQEKQLLTNPPSEKFIQELKSQNVTPLAVGDTIVATWRPQETVVLDVIRKLGLDLQITFNKDAVMVLPAGVTKGTGVQAALKTMGLSAHNVVGIGDAENDHAFLELCECNAVVQNALPSLKEHADFVAGASHGAGVEELIEKLMGDDLAELEGRLQRHQVLLGKNADGDSFYLNPYGSRLLVAGPSGSGKSSFVSALIERLAEKQYQICLIDPEGDYHKLDTFLTLGRTDHKPDISEIMDALEDPFRSLTINLLGVSLPDRPAFFQQILSRIQELRSKTGRPQWVIIDEAHHLLPASLDSASLVIPQDLSSMALITVHPDHVSPSILSLVNGLVLVGPDTRSVAAQFNAGASATLDLSSSALQSAEPGTAVVWLFGQNRNPEKIKIEPAKIERRRHKQKYAVGELGEDKSFYFRGPEQKLNLRAQNMTLFAQIAEGVDEATWSYHLRAHDYSQWLRDAVKDDELAQEVASIEEDEKLSATDSRKAILSAIRKQYTAPA